MMVANKMGRISMMVKVLVPMVCVIARARSEFGVSKVPHGRINGGR